MLRTIRIYGRLSKFLKRRKFEAAVANTAEAVRFLLANFPQLEEHMADQHYKVLVGGREIDQEELHYPSGASEEIRIVPVLAGAGATGKIIAGVAIIALSLGIGAIASAGVALGGLMGIGTVGTIFAGIGASLVLFGVSQMLTPTPTVTSGSGSDDDPRKSYSFSGIQNVSRQGVPVPIVYGETLVGSVVVSAGIDIDQVVV
jgi:predicted phage tail protein